MSSGPPDNLHDAPKIVPSRDEVVSYQRQQKARAKVGSSVPNVGADGGGSSSTGIKVVVGLLVLALLGVGGWAYTTHQRLQTTQRDLGDYVQRLEVMERRLMLTDESMEMSSEAMKVKLTEFDVEIRKLWDNVWKRSKERLDTLEKNDQQTKAFIAATTKQLNEDKLLIESLNEQLNKLTRMEAAVASAEQELKKQEKLLETATDKASRAQGDVAKLDGRVKSTEEWVDSINAFRKQVNQELTALKAGGAAPQ